ncbi:hypothetical protein BC834DRAFT_888538, partial [Gloeopeniophorella convolvens]
TDISRCWRSYVSNTQSHMVQMTGQPRLQVKLEPSSFPRFLPPPAQTPSRPRRPPS